MERKKRRKKKELEGKDTMKKGKEGRRRENIEKRGIAFYIVSVSVLPRKTSFLQILTYS
jgi:hypothetical protein